LRTLFLFPTTAAVCLLSSMTIAQTTVGYTSPITDYQKFVDEKVLPWKAANDKVAEIGGWRAYAKEAQLNAMTVLPADVASTDVLSAEKMAKMPFPVRIAWLQAVAKQEQLVHAKQAHASAQASSELAKRMRSVGNFTRLQQANQHAMYAEAATLLLTSTQEATEAREFLIRAMGLNDIKARALVLPDRLPELPVSPIAEIALNRVVRATESQMFASEAPSELRSSYAAYRNAYDLAKHYRDEILPLQKIIAEEATLRYNGMFIGVFELLAQNREQTKMVMASIAATQAFWQADAGFQDTLQTQLNTTSAHPAAE
jgi:outer membrane protein TolC